MAYESGAAAASHHTVQAGASVFARAISAYVLGSQGQPATSENEFIEMGNLLCLV